MSPFVRGALVALLVPLVPLALGAQGRLPRDAGRDGPRATQRAQARDSLQARQMRDSLEVRVRQRMGQMLRTQLGLDDDQMRRLTATNSRFEGERRALFQQERETRMSLRDELASGDTTRGDQVTQLLDRMLQLQRRRLDLLESEQKELAAFLTPVQRARYFGLEEQIRRRMNEMREGRQGQDRRTGPQQPRGGATPGARRPRAQGPSS